MVRFRGTSMNARLGKIAMGVTIYFLWQEINCRIVHNNVRSTDMVLGDIEQCIVAIMWR